MANPDNRPIPVALRLRIKAMLDAKLSVEEIFERLAGAEAGTGLDPALVARALRTFTPGFTPTGDPFNDPEMTVPTADEMLPILRREENAAGAAHRDETPVTDVIDETEETKSEPAPTPPPPPAEPAIANDVSRLFSLLNLNIGDDTPGIVVQFIGSHRGEGTSTVAREFAHICTVHSDRPVLLLDLDFRRDHQFDYFAERRGRDKELRRPGSAADLGVDLGQLVRLEKDITGLGDNEHLITAHRVGDTSLYVSRVHSYLRERKAMPQMTKALACWKQLRQVTAVTVVDSPPFTESFDGLSVSGLVDHAVLVVEAESTRMPVVAEFCDRLASQNAPIAGIVFNKRRFYIPRFIYRWI